MFLDVIFEKQHSSRAGQQFRQQGQGYKSVILGSVPQWLTLHACALMCCVHAQGGLVLVSLGPAPCQSLHWFSSMFISLINPPSSHSEVVALSLLKNLWFKNINWLPQGHTLDVRRAEFGFELGSGWPHRLPLIHQQTPDNSTSLCLRHNVRQTKMVNAQK